MAWSIVLLQKLILPISSNASHCYRTCRVYKSLSLVPILSKINAVHALLSCCFKVPSIVGHCRALFVATRSKAWVCGHLLAEIAGSNPVRGMDVSSANIARVVG